MRSLPPKLTAQAWDFGSAARSLNRMAAACGLPPTLRPERVFTSLYLGEVAEVRFIAKRFGSSLDDVPGVFNRTCAGRDTRGAAYRSATVATNEEKVREQQIDLGQVLDL